MQKEFDFRMKEKFLEYGGEYFVVEDGPFFGCYQVR